MQNNYLKALNNSKHNLNKKINDLIIENVYEVKVFKNVKTANGDRVIATIIDGDCPVDVFLPNRFAHIKTNYNVSDIGLKYGGLQPMKDDLQFHKLEFVSLSIL